MRESKKHRKIHEADGLVGSGRGPGLPSDERIRSIEHKWAAKVYLT